MVDFIGLGAKKVLVAKIMVVAFALFSAPLVVGGNNVSAKESTDIICNTNIGVTPEQNNTESKEDKNENAEAGGEGVNGGGDIADFEVTMNNNGTLNITGLENNNENSWTTIFKNYKVIIMGFSGIATLTFVALFIKNFISLGANADNPQGRKSAIAGCLWTGIATGLCGGIMIVVGLFWNVFK